MLIAKRVIILAFISLVLYFWVVSIFSEQNAPGRGGRYVYSNSLENEKRESDNTFGSFEQPPSPPAESPAANQKPEQPQGKVEIAGTNPPDKEGGKGPQPEPPKPPQPSAIPYEVPRPSPAPPDHKEVPHTPVTQGVNDSAAGQPEASPQPSLPTEKPALPETAETARVPGATGVKPETVPDNKAVVTSDVTKKTSSDIIKKFNPKDIVLEDYFNQRLNIQIACPKNWTITQSKTQSEFKCESTDIENLFFICRRSRIMEGRKFNEEVDEIIKNETFGKNIQNKKAITKDIGEHKLARITFDEFEAISDKKKKNKNHLLYIFIESGDEVSMFYFLTPSLLKDKMVPIFEKSIKSIRIIKRPKPAGTKN